MRLFEVPICRARSLIPIGSRLLARLSRMATVRRTDWVPSPSDLVTVGIEHLHMRGQGSGAAILVIYQNNDAADSLNPLHSAGQQSPRCSDRRNNLAVHQNEC